MNLEFWNLLDQLVEEAEIVIDRPKGSRHPQFKNVIYPLDYGYLENTTSHDGEGIDVWKGSKTDIKIESLLCTVDGLKKDAEIKLLIGCTEQEQQIIYQFHNETNYQKGILIQRFKF